MQRTSRVGGIAEGNCDSPAFEKLLDELVTDMDALGETVTSRRQRTRPKKLVINTRSKSTKSAGHRASRKKMARDDISVGPLSPDANLPPMAGSAPIVSAVDVPSDSPQATRSETGTTTSTTASEGSGAVDVDELYQMLVENDESTAQPQTFLDQLCTLARECHATGQPRCILPLQVVIRDPIVQSAIQRLWAITVADSARVSAAAAAPSASTSVVPYSSIMGGRLANISPETQALLNIVASSAEHTAMVKAKMELRYVNGQIAVECDVHQVFNGRNATDENACDPKTCVYVRLTNIPQDQQEAEAIVERLKAEGIVSGVPSVDPTANQVWVCMQHKRFHDCRLHTCSHTASDNGEYVCLFTGESYGKVVSDVDPDRNTIFRDGDDESRCHIAGHTAYQMTENAHSSWSSHIATTAERASMVMDTSSNYMAVIKSTPWHVGSHRAVARMEQATKHTPPVIAMCNGLATLRNALEICSHATERTATKAAAAPTTATTQATSMANHAWDIGSSFDRRRGGASADKRIVRETVQLESDDGRGGDTTPQYDMSTVIDVPWLTRLATLFDCADLCAPYIRLAHHPVNTAVPPECEYVITELRQITQNVDHMFVNLPTTFTNNPMAANAVSLAEWQSRIIVRYTAVLLRGWVLSKLSSTLTADTTSMIRRINALYPRGIPTVARTVAPSVLSPPPQRTPPPLPPLPQTAPAMLMSDSQPARLMLEDVPQRDIESDMRIGNCVVGAMYVLKAGFVTLADFTTVLPEHIVDALLKVVEANTNMTRNAYKMTHCMPFVNVDPFAASCLVGETRLVSAKRTMRHDEVKSSIDTELASGHRATGSGTPGRRTSKSAGASSSSNGGTRTRKHTTSTSVHIDCQVATAGQADVKCQFGHIGVWSLAKFAHDVLCDSVPFAMAEEAFSARIKGVCINSDPTGGDIF